MQRILLTLFLVTLCSPVFCQEEKTVPDTVHVGIYLNSIHDIDFKQKEFNVNFWLWLKYKNKAFDFAHNLEIPNAKTFSTAYLTVDSSNDRIYMLMKVQAVMKDSWKIGNFPFDKQKLRISIENSQFDSSALVFKVDTVGDNYDKRYVLSGWRINPDSFQMVVENRTYRTTFGDENVKKPLMKYSAFKIRIGIERDASGLFWKMFLGMYIAFLIAFICFFIHADGIDSRFGLSVGSLFAVIGNKYIVDSSLPESTSFTVVDALHGITLFSIFIVITATAYSLKLVKQNKAQAARRFDRITASVLLLFYIIMNSWLIYQASH